MFDALQIAATGMHAQQQNVDAIANNLANVNTTGFKKARVSFSDLVTRQQSETSSANTAACAAEGTNFCSALRGTGVAIAKIAQSFDAGEARKTDSAYDITIAGDGFLEVIMPDGTQAFSRGGTLRINADGQLATASGQPLKPGIAIPEDVQDIAITSDGRVQVKTDRKSVV